MLKYSNYLSLTHCYWKWKVKQFPKHFIFGLNWYMILNLFSKHFFNSFELYLQEFVLSWVINNKTYCLIIAIDTVVIFECYVCVIKFSCNLFHRTFSKCYDLFFHCLVRVINDLFSRIYLTKKCEYDYSKTVVQKFRQLATIMFSLIFHTGWLSRKEKIIIKC